MKKRIWAATSVLIVASGVAIYSGNDRALSIMALVVGLTALVFMQVRDDSRLPAIKTLDAFCWTRSLSILYGSVMVFASLRLVFLVAGLLLFAHGEFVRPIVGYLVEQGQQLEAEQTVPEALLEDLLVTQLAVEGLMVDLLLRPFYLIIFLFFGSPLLYVGGRRMGRRSSAAGTPFSGTFDVLTATALAVLVSVGLELLVLGRAEVYDQVQDVQQAESVMTDDYGQTAITLLYVFSAVSLLLSPVLGYWTGRRQRIGSYMNYALRTMLAGEQAAIAARVHREATREGGNGTSGDGNPSSDGADSRRPRQSHGA